MHFTVLTNSVLGLALLSLLQAREEERGLGMRFDLSNGKKLIISCMCYRARRE